MKQYATDLMDILHRL